MDFDDDPLELLDDDGDGVNEMCLLFDEDGGDRQNSSQPTQGKGCAVVMLCMGAGAVTAGLLFAKMIA